VDNVLAATRRDGKAELSFGEGAGAEDARRIAGLVRALRGREWVKKVDKRLVEPLLRAHRDAALCDQVDSDLELCSAAADAPAILWTSQPPPSARRHAPARRPPVQPPALGAPARPAPCLVRRVLLGKVDGSRVETIDRIRCPPLHTAPPVSRAARLSDAGVRSFVDKGAQDTPVSANEGAWMGRDAVAVQASPWLAGALADPKEAEQRRAARAWWAPASGIGSLGPAFGADASMFAEAPPELPPGVSVVASAAAAPPAARDWGAGAPAHLARALARGEEAREASGMRTIQPWRFSARLPDRVLEPFGPLPPAFCARKHPHQRSNAPCRRGRARRG